MKGSKLFVRIIVVLIAGYLSGCATTEYTTHYGIFTGENSAGEVRQFRMYWQTVHYEGWLEDIDRPLPVVLETQCSLRKLRFYDASFGRGRRCEDAKGEGIFYCTDETRDVDWRGLPMEDNVLCGAITDRFGATDIMSLEGEVLLWLNCQPEETEKRVGTKIKNVDTLKNSVMPYVVSTKKVKGVKSPKIEDIDLFVPQLFNHSSICDPDE